MRKAENTSVIAARLSSRCCNAFTAAMQHVVPSETSAQPAETEHNNHLGKWLTPWSQIGGLNDGNGAL